MKESAVFFGATRSLSGILTEPAVDHAGRPAVLLLNAGLLHRVGPNRIYVTLARRLAAAGFPVLRFDFSGLGESESRRDELTIEQSSLAEGREAMDFLVASGVADRFVPMGLCAGAENAQRIAVQDPRVAGAAMIDGYAYRTAGFYFRHFGRRVTSGRTWRNFLTGQSGWRRTFRGVLPAAEDNAPSNGGAPGGGLNFLRVFPPKAVCLTELQGLLARQMDLFLLFTGGGMEDYYNYAEQFGDAFPALRAHPRIRVRFIASADHTFTLRSDQETLVSSITGWAQAALSGGTADVARRAAS